MTSFTLLDKKEAKILSKKGRLDEKGIAISGRVDTDSILSISGETLYATGYAYIRGNRVILDKVVSTYTKDKIVSAVFQDGALVLILPYDKKIIIPLQNEFREKCVNELIRVLGIQIAK